MHGHMNLKFIKFHVRYLHQKVLEDLIYVPLVEFRGWKVCPAELCLHWRIQKMSHHIPSVYGTDYY